MKRGLHEFIQEGVLNKPSIGQVHIAATMEKQKITAMGGNDVEFGVIDSIVKQAVEGTLEAAEAILRIESISENKHGNGGHGLQG